MVARSTFDSVGLLFEETSLGADDLEFSWRLRVLSHSLAVAWDAFGPHDVGASFEPLPSAERRERIGKRDQVLVQKLKEFYDGQLPTSEWQFNCDAFAAALPRD